MRTGTQPTNEELHRIAARFGACLPESETLTGTVLPDGWEITEGETPAPYLPHLYAGAANEPTGLGTRRRASRGEDGRSRNLTFPPAPAPLPYAIVDNHTHMDLLDGQVSISARDALDTGEKLGVGAIVQVGCDVPSSLYALAAAEADARVLAAVAIHPNTAAELADQDALESALEVIENLGAHERVRAIGETGLDYFRTGEGGREAQQHSFREHIRIAKKHSLALQIHDRDAHEDVVRILDEEGAPATTVFHCFSGGEELAAICNERGWYMSFAGTVTFKNSRDIQRALSIAKPELILAETDAPFLTPHPWRGRPNASYMSNYTVRFMASHRGEDLLRLCRTVRANSIAAYGHWGIAGF